MHHLSDCATENFAALEYAELPRFMVKLAARPSKSARALELTILTALRTCEVIEALWSEFNPDFTVWSIPGERMKNGKPHNVPLSAPATALLRRLHAEREADCPFVFPGQRAGKPLCNVALLKVLKLMGATFVTHGFRATFKTWGEEKTGHDSKVIEKALSHTIGNNEVERKYMRGELLDKRRTLMTDWAAFATSDMPVPAAVTPEDDNIVVLKRAAA
jgi:integrase